MTAGNGSTSRRNFLRTALLAGSGLLALGGLVRFLGFQSEAPRQTEFDLGPAGDYPPGSRTLVAAAQALLIHGPEGFTALSLVCPHLGCQVAPTADGFACPCHGSRFDAQGALLRGPADKAMRSLKVLLAENGHLMLYTE